jgi:hypothetical protein
MNTKRACEECYGNLFPDFTRLKASEKLEGQAFTALVTGSGTGAQGRSLELNTTPGRSAWSAPTTAPATT